MVKYTSLALAAVAAFIAPAMGSPACKPKSSTTTSSTTSVITTAPDCVFRPQATWYALDSPKCDFKCPTSIPWCIADAAVTVPCGCTAVTVSPTTTTLCPTNTNNCAQCSTGWGIVTFTETGCPTPAPTAP
ncbi:hypothetical protein VTJ49DRAFT_4760 [Mycothermus thermophilus]|uniref:Uncharacterized protein n=1 Tax=Humicola insolens TaxID=85995 RepID=A0ABR3VL02_HUMIN